MGTALCLQLFSLQQPLAGKRDRDVGREGHPAEAPNQRLLTLSCPDYHLPSDGVEITCTFTECLLCVRLNARCLKRAYSLIYTPPHKMDQVIAPLSPVQTQKHPESQLAQGQLWDLHPGIHPHTTAGALHTATLDLHLGAPQVGCKSTHRSRREEAVHLL